MSDTDLGDEIEKRLGRKLKKGEFIHFLGHSPKEMLELADRKRKEEHPAEMVANIEKKLGPTERLNTTMTTKFEDIVKSLKELQTYAESCNKDTIDKTSSISSIIERSFARNEMSETVYIELKKIKLESIDKYKDRCVCINKDGITPDLRQILSKYKYI